MLSKMISMPSTAERCDNIDATRAEFVSVPSASNEELAELDEALTAEAAVIFQLHIPCKPVRPRVATTDVPSARSIVVLIHH